MYSTTRADVNCTDEFRMLQYRVVKRVYTIFLRAKLKKCAIHVPLLFSAMFPLYFIVVWNKGLLGLKKRRVDSHKASNALWK